MQELSLVNNQIGNAGVEALAKAAADGALASVSTLDLGRNQIGDDGMKSLSSALSMGALASLTMIMVGGRHGRHPQLMAACQQRGITIA